MERHCRLLLVLLAPALLASALQLDAPFSTSSSDIHGSASARGFQFQEYNPDTSGLTPSDADEFRTEMETAAKLSSALNHAAEEKLRELQQQDVESLGDAFHVLASKNAETTGFAIVEECHRHVVPTWPPSVEHNDTLWIVFRGSGDGDANGLAETFRDVDASAAPHGLTGDLACLGVHRGFYEGLKEVVESMMDSIIGPFDAVSKIADMVTKAMDDNPDIKLLPAPFKNFLNKIVRNMVIEDMRQQEMQTIPSGLYLILLAWFNKNSSCSDFRVPGIGSGAKFKKVRFAGFGTGGSLATLAGTFSFLAQDFGSTSGNQDFLSEDWWTNPAKYSPTYFFFNALSVAALNKWYGPGPHLGQMVPLDETSYTQIRTVALEAPPVFSRAGLISDAVDKATQEAVDQIFKNGMPPDVQKWLPASAKDNLRFKNHWDVNPVCPKTVDVQTLLTGDNIIRRRLVNTRSVNTASGIDVAPRLRYSSSSNMSDHAADHDAIDSKQFLGHLGWGDFFTAPYNKVLLFANNTETSKAFLELHYADEEIAREQYRNRVLEIPTNLLAGTKLLGLEYVIPPMQAFGHDVPGVRNYAEFLYNLKQHGETEHEWILTQIDAWKQDSWWKKP